MMRSEKFAVYLILFFVIVVVSVNIFASLSMLIIDKQEDIGIYKAMGARIKHSAGHLPCTDGLSACPEQ